mmetsp:Transcript_15363/g.33301  ORF Transcript_15363/g.33301 Transcript_15363/m.33301 type:complete len:245 (-) Transcript_15363:388-1122(-)
MEKVQLNTITTENPFPISPPSPPSYSFNHVRRHTLRRLGNILLPPLSNSLIHSLAPPALTNLLILGLRFHLPQFATLGIVSPTLAGCHILAHLLLDRVFRSANDVGPLALCPFLREACEFLLIVLERPFVLDHAEFSSFLLSLLARRLPCFYTAFELFHFLLLHLVQEPVSFIEYVCIQVAGQTDHSRIACLVFVGSDGHSYPGRVEIGSTASKVITTFGRHFSGCMLGLFAFRFTFGIIMDII